MKGAVDINLSPIEKVFEVTLTGKKPLLMHNPVTSMAVSEEWKRKGVSHPPSDVQAESGLYKDTEGNVVIPFLNLLGVLRVGAVDKKIGGQGKKTFKKLVFSGLEIEPDNPKLIYDKWVIDSRPVVIGKARVMANRPRFDQWSVTFRIRVVDPVFLEPTNQGGEIIKDILTVGGKRGGLGDFRPLFGQFIVSRFEEVSG
jgi:hypothetical protein